MAITKRNIIYLYNLLLVTSSVMIGCNEGNKPSEKPSSKRYNSLLIKYKAISLDTLEVYSHGGDTGKYFGVVIDSEEARLFPSEIAEAHFNDKPGLFAVCKFPIDDSVIGLVTRSPSMYWPSSIKIFFFDKLKDSIRSYVELAETWGDAGDVFIKRSWLFRDNHNLHALIWDMESHAHEVDDPSDTTVESFDKYYILDLSKYKSDTISTDSAMLRSGFNKLLTQATEIK